MNTRHKWTIFWGPLGAALLIVALWGMMSHAAVGAAPMSTAEDAASKADLPAAPSATGDRAPTATCAADSFGYTCVDSNEPGGPTFNWIDISATGISMTLSDDNHFYPIALPFDFNFYGTPYNQVAVGSNGIVYFENEYLGLQNTSIPGPNTYEVNMFIAVYWDDLNPGAGGDVYYEVRGSAPARYLVVQYEGVFNFGTWDPITVQAILYEGSNDILVQYLDPSSEAGSGATVGIQEDTTTGLQYSYNTAALSAGLAICYQPPATSGGCGAAVIWDGGGVDHNWSTAENWLGDQPPLITDTVVFNGTSSKDAIVDNAFTGMVEGLIVDATYGGTITQTASFAISDTYYHQGGIMVVDGAAPLTVGNVLSHTGGILQQTQSVNNVDVAFLEIDDGAAGIRYRGIDLDTSTAGNDLGAVTVRIRRVDGVNTFCTQDAGSSPAYGLRCFEIVPTNNLAADNVRLWLHTSEQNGIAAANLLPYRNPDGDGVWTLMSGASTGNDGGSFVYTQAPTPGFSDFLAGSGNAPTAVTVQSTTADSASAPWPAATVVTLLLLLTGTAVRLWRDEL